MRRIYTGLVFWNLAVIAATGTLGGLAYAGALDTHVHRLAGLFTAFFGCLVHSLVVIHFIGSMKWIQQTSPTAGLDDEAARPIRRAWIKGRMFPVLVFTMLWTVAVAVAGGRADSGAAASALHLMLAIGLVPMNLWALSLARRGLSDNLDRMRRVGGLAETRVRAGLVREESNQALLPESGRAGGKVFVFLGLNVWLVYGYARFVLRRHGEPVLPYLAASILLLGLGLGMLRSSGSRAEPPPNGEPHGEDDGPRRPRLTA